MAGPPYQVLVDRLGGAPTFGRGELIDGITAAAMRLQAARLIAAGALVGLGPDIAPLVAGYTGSGLLSARPVAPDVPAGATAFYFATDTATFSTWNGSAWVNSSPSTILKFENWDGVTAPTIPAGWNVDTSYLSVSTANSPTSSPNSLIYAPANADGTQVPTATWASPDTAGGNVQVSATVRFANSAGTGEQGVALLARGDAAATGWGASSFYYAYLARTGGVSGLSIGKRVSGTGAYLSAHVGAAALADATNYRLFLRCSGSTIQACCQKLSDGSWLDSSGAFVVDATSTTVAVSAVDTAIPAAAGYAGAWFYLADGSGGPVGLDDWLLEAL